MNRRRRKAAGVRKKIIIVVLLILSGFVIFFGLYIFLPSLITFFSPAETNTIITPNQVTSDRRDLGKLLSDNKIEFNHIEKASESSTLITKLSSGGYVYFDSSKDLASQARLLSLLLNRMTIEEKNKKIQYIDMRFEKAIVKFE